MKTFDRNDYPTEKEIEETIKRSLRSLDWLDKFLRGIEKILTKSFTDTKGW